MASEDDNGWNVKTLKQRFDSLRAEDQRAIALLARDLGSRFDKLNESFDELNTAFERFQAAYGSTDKKGQRDVLVIFNIITILVRYRARHLQYLHAPLGKSGNEMRRLHTMDAASQDRLRQRR